MRPLLAVLVFVALSGCSTVPKNSAAMWPVPHDVGQKHLYWACNIADASTGTQLRSYPGDMCVYFKNGDLLSSTGKELILYDPKLKVKWTRELILNHQLKLSRDGTEILAIASDYHKMPEGNLRFDTLLVLDLSGRTLKRFSFFEHQDLFPHWRYSLRKVYPNIWTNDGVQNSLDVTHINSFYEIPPESMGPYWGKDLEFGYAISCVNLKRVLYLDKDLLKVTASFLNNGQLHDVQPLENGLSLRYRNLGRREPTLSSVEVVNLLTSQVVWSYQGNGNPFFSKCCGGVQRLENGDLLVSDNRNEIPQVEWVSPDGKSIRNLRIPTTGWIQEAHIGDLTEFLKKNQGY